MIGPSKKKFFYGLRLSGKGTLKSNIMSGHFDQAGNGKEAKRSF